jgi:hypothetical protein
VNGGVAVGTGAIATVLIVHDEQNVRSGRTATLAL